MAEQVYTEAFLQSEQGDAAFRKLMSAPVSAPRKRIRRAKVEVAESIDTAGKSLADIVRGRGKPYRSILSKPMPTYRQWLGKFLNADEADREDARARAEWAERKVGLYSREVRRRQKQIVRGILSGAVACAPVANFPGSSVDPHAPLSAFVRNKGVKGRGAWRDFRPEQIAGLVAAGEWQYLADCGRPSIHPGSEPQRLLPYRTAEIIAMPVLTELRAAA